MATQSCSPKPTIDNNNNNSYNSDTVKISLNECQATQEPPVENPQKTVSVNSQPLREELVQHAIKFLSHSQVKGSPIVHRRNFLEKKGLTEEEIDEAFKCVPDPSPVAANDQTSTHQEKDSTDAHFSGLMCTMTRRFHWPRVLLAIGFLAISGAGTTVIFKNSVIPWLKSWTHRAVSDEDVLFQRKSDGKPSLAEDVAAAAKAAAAAAADVARVTQEILIAKNEEKKYFTKLTSLLDVQIREMRTLTTVISNIERWDINLPARNSTYVPQPHVDVTIKSNTLTGQKNDPSSFPRGTKNPRLMEIKKWVPPEAPSVSVPEAAIAIRQPKSISRGSSLRAKVLAKQVIALQELHRGTENSDIVDAS